VHVLPIYYSNKFIKVDMKVAGSWKNAEEAASDN